MRHLETLSPHPLLPPLRPPQATDPRHPPPPPIVGFEYKGREERRGEERRGEERRGEERRGEERRGEERRGEEGGGGEGRGGEGRGEGRGGEEGRGEERRGEERRGEERKINIYADQGSTRRIQEGDWDEQGGRRHPAERAGEHERGLPATLQDRGAQRGKAEEDEEEDKER